MRDACLVILLSGAFASTRAALPPLSPEERDEFAEVILTGEVLVSRTLIHRKPSSSIYSIRLGVQIGSIEKGEDLLGEAKSIEIRCWRIRKTKLVGPGGHLNIPAEGSRFRTWLRKNRDGQWEPLEPNGIELLDGSPAMTITEVERRSLGKGILFWGIAGLLGLGFIIWMRVSK